MCDRRPNVCRHTPAEPHLDVCRLASPREKFLREAAVRKIFSTQLTSIAPERRRATDEALAAPPKKKKFEEGVTPTTRVSGGRSNVESAVMWSQQ